MLKSMDNGTKAVESPLLPPPIDGYTGFVFHPMVVDLPLFLNSQVPISL